MAISAMVSPVMAAMAWRMMLGVKYGAINNIGLQLGILNTALYTLMVVMAIVTTGMAGPLLRVIYPDRIMERDIAESDGLGRSLAPGYRAMTVRVTIDSAVAMGSNRGVRATTNCTASCMAARVADPMGVW